MSRRFLMTFDYLCPFARNANEHVLEGLSNGADWEVTFLPYSLVQGRVDDDQEAAWDRPEPYRLPGILALSTGLTVRDHFHDAFPAVHRELFAARHDHGEDIKERAVVHAALERAGVSADEVLDVVDTGEALVTLRKEHERAVRDHDVWGVPTFIGSSRAVFARLLSRPGGDPAFATTTIERVLDLVDGWADLHEFKQTDLPI